MKLISHCLTAVHQLAGILSLIGVGNLIGPATIQCFTSGNLTQRLQRGSVRSSMGFHPHFNLLMGRSPGFGSMATNFAPYSDSLSLRLRYSIP